MLQTLITIVWIISALMGCWSFSLFIRWVSERRTKRSSHLQSVRSARSQWVGFALIFVCLGVSIFAAIMGMFLENWSLNRVPVTVIGGSVSLFAVFLVIWASIGDPARGRIRCPKCWYDMSAGVGLRCPECGHEAKSKAAFSKSRRPRWAFLVAVMLLVPGIYGIVMNRDVTKYGPLGFVPTWVLMAGWEVIPESWIGVDWNTSVDGCLRERLEDDRVSRSRMLRFGDRLCEPLMENRDARTDPRRTTLLYALLSEMTTEFDERTGSHVWAEPSVRVDVEQLLRLSIADAIDAIMAENPSPDQLATIESFSEKGFIALDWFFAKVHSSGRLEEDGSFFSPEFFAFTEKVVGEPPQELSTPRFGRNLIDADYRRNNLAWTIANVTGVYRDHMGSYFDASYAPDLASIGIRVIKMTHVYNTLSSEEQVPILNRLTEWAISDDPAQRYFAVLCAKRMGSDDLVYGPSPAILSRFRVYSSHPDTLGAFHELRAAIIAQVISDDRVPNPDDVSAQDSLHYMALVALNEITPGDAGVYKLFRESLLSGRETPEIHVDYLPEERVSFAVRVWVEQFGDLHDHESASVRAWFDENTPGALKTGSAAP